MPSHPKPLAVLVHPFPVSPCVLSMFPPIVISTLKPAFDSLFATLFPSLHGTSWEAHQAAVDAFQVQELDCYLLPRLLDLCPPYLQPRKCIMVHDLILGHPAPHRASSFQCQLSLPVTGIKAEECTVALTPRPHSSTNSYAALVVGHSLQGHSARTCRETS